MLQDSIVSRIDEEKCTENVAQRSKNFLCTLFRSSVHFAVIIRMNGKTLIRQTISRSQPEQNHFNNNIFFVSTKSPAPKEFDGITSSL